MSGLKDQKRAPRQNKHKKGSSFVRLGAPAKKMRAADLHRARFSDPQQLTKWSRISDRLGVYLSSLCVVHCALMPVLFMVLPSFSYLVSHDVFHVIMLLLLPLVAFVAFVPGYRAHRDPIVFVYGGFGLVLLGVAVLLFHDSRLFEALFSIAGSLTLIRAHQLNRRLCVYCGNLEKKFA